MTADAKKIQLLKTGLYIFVSHLRKVLVFIVIKLPTLE